jgi:hypothetical protein
MLLRSFEKKWGRREDVNGFLERKEIDRNIFLIQIVVFT